MHTGFASVKDYSGHNRQNFNDVPPYKILGYSTGEAFLFIMNIEILFINFGTVKYDH